MYKFFKKVIERVLIFLNSFITYKDNEVISRRIYYWREGYKRYLDGSLWDRESYYWLYQEPRSYETANITCEKPIYWIPKEVKTFYVVTKYGYGGCVYKHLTKNRIPEDDEHIPVKPHAFTFRLPVKSVLVHDSQTDAPLFNITKKFKRYTGPYGNTTITPYDMLLGLKEDDFYITIEDIVGNIRRVHSSDLVAK